MKTLITTLAIASALSFNAFGAEEDLKDLSTVHTNFKKISVSLYEGVGVAKIAILDMKGKKLHIRKVNVKDVNLVVPYDMEDLPEGEYQVRITTDVEEVTYRVETIEKPAPVKDFPLMAYGKALNGNKINLAVIGLTEPGVNVKIRSVDNGKLIYEEDIDQAEGFKKDFVLKSMNSKDVYMEVTDSLGRSRVLFF
ncbi:hypothetical protein [Algoriphagus chordae]|uniref:Secreted protein (Por secretion system target) n=1 Tax=Algoriphagus chordae TaxID=237019 RepID=A0A2W7R1V8_9BACT|nr:hypothetical protein [Algoriphagus chordae]PZX54813.1 hypothetical protein LV85_01151 [Algoriphagus chordae]